MGISGILGNLGIWHQTDKLLGVNKKVRCIPLITDQLTRPELRGVTVAIKAT